MCVRVCDVSVRARARLAVVMEEPKRPISLFSSSFATQTKFFYVFLQSFVELDGDTTIRTLYICVYINMRFEHGI